MFFLPNMTYKTFFLFNMTYKTFSANQSFRLQKIGLLSAVLLILVAKSTGNIMVLGLTIIEQYLNGPCIFALERNESGL